MDEKLRLNVEDAFDPALISKKFWKHIKSKSKSTRIPETFWYAKDIEISLSTKQN